MTTSLLPQPARFAIGIGIFLLGAAATHVAINLLLLLAHFLEPGASDTQVVTIEIVRFLLSITGGLVISRLATLQPWRRPRPDMKTVRDGHSKTLRLAITLFGVAYLATWGFGVPTVQSALADNALQTYKKLESRDHSPDWQNYPFIRTYVAFPPLPFLIVTYHEYQLAGLHGWGGWQLHFWFPGHIRKLGSRMAWIS
jgi:hypothetical protein